MAVEPPLPVGRATPANSPMVRLAVCWLAGAWLGWLGRGWADVWLTIASASAIPMVWQLTRGRWRAARCWGVITAITVSGAWTDLSIHRVADDDIAGHITKTPQLALITGVVEGPLNPRDGPRGEFGRFGYRPASLSFVLRVESMVVDRVDQSASGRVLIYFVQEDHRINIGDRIRVTGWLGPLRDPLNPGGYDFNGYMARRGVSGTVRVPTRRNWQPVGRAVWGYPIRMLRRWVAGAVTESLHVGLAYDPIRVGFLDRLLLGRRSGPIGDLETGFRRVGLAHLLSISGAHLGILLGLMWLLGRAALLTPQQAAVLVLLTLGAYLLAVPLKVPVIRAGVMAGFLCIGYAAGRPIRTLDLMALAAVALVIWQPAELFTAGFQLSFGVVLALLVLTQPVSHRLWPDPPVILDADRLRVKVVRAAVNLVAAHLVAFATAMPLVAFHFGWVSPLALVLSLLAFPWVIAVMGLGYLKILVGLILPSLGLVLAGPLEFAADSMIALVRHAATWPAAVVELSRPPTLAWTVASLGVVVAALGGWFTRRPLAMGMSLGVCGLWLIGSNPVAPLAGWGVEPRGAAALKLNMFAVGDGSCYVVRIGAMGDGPRSGHGDVVRNRTPREVVAQEIRGPGHTLMYDCGSQGFFDVGAKTIVPALRHLGIRSIDTLIVSHADLDHYNGALAVVEGVAVGRVLVSHQMADEAIGRPDGPVAFLMDKLMEKGVAVEAIGRGFVEKHGCGVIEALWPPAGYETKQANNASLVVSIRASGRRLLLGGDIQTQAIEALLKEAGGLSADICDLPHHGGFVKGSSQWLESVSPALVLQSSGPQRLERDPWQPWLKRGSIRRLATARVGMVEVMIGYDGAVKWKCFRGPSGQLR